VNLGRLAKASPSSKVSSASLSLAYLHIIRLPIRSFFPRTIHLWTFARQLHRVESAFSFHVVAAKAARLRACIDDCAMPSPALGAGLSRVCRRAKHPHCCTNRSIRNCVSELDGCGGLETMFFMSFLQKTSPLKSAKCEIHLSTTPSRSSSLQMANDGCRRRLLKEAC
jgi:hypothetical protein